jgi:uncharacterized protein (TIGR03086 family)
MNNQKLTPEVISDCYLRSLDSTINFVSNVPDGAWGNATPCDEWDVKDVVNHIVYENVWMVALFNGQTIEEVGDKFEGDLVGNDPKGVYLKTAAEVKAVLTEPDAMSRTCQISSGPVSGAEYASQLFLDTLIHGWDIAVGSKQNATLDAYLVENCTPLAERIAGNDGYRSVFKAPTSGHGSDNAQTNLLALLGREG